MWVFISLLFIGLYIKYLTYSVEIIEESSCPPHIWEHKLLDTETPCLVCIKCKKMPLEDNNEIE